jgi:hypothetical protein
MVKQLLHTVYQIKKVIEGPKIVEENGKKVPFYKVRWVDTYEPAYNLPKEEIQNFKNKKKVSDSIFIVIILLFLEESKGVRSCNVRKWRLYFAEYEFCRRNVCYFMRV